MALKTFLKKEIGFKAIRQAVYLVFKEKRSAPYEETKNSLIKELQHVRTAQAQELKNMQQMLDYYYYEISELRSKVRHLVANSPIAFPSIQQTYESFDYQWNTLNEGPQLLTDDAFKSNVTQIISDYTQLPAQWFAGKKVLDAGCGQGRFTYGFSLLNADLVAIDQSEHAVANTTQIIKKLAPAAIVKQHDILKPFPFDQPFDLVWSYGVLHHTGNTYQAFQNIASLVKPNGYLFLMLYGEPQLRNISSFQEQMEYSRLRALTRHLNYADKIKLLLNEKPKEQLHGWFDAISPAVNDTYSLEEIKTWLTSAGFGNIKVTSPSTNHHIVAQRVNT